MKCGGINLGGIMGDRKTGVLIIYTDGSFRNKNINGGGWGYVFIYAGELVDMAVWCDQWP